MKAMVIDGFGGADKLHWAEVPTTAAGPGEVLIKLAATSVNPVDWKIREGYLAKAFPNHFPLIPGWDAAGTIAAVGTGVHGFHAGDTVYAYARKPQVQWGTYAEFVALDAQAVAFAPRGIGLEAAAKGLRAAYVFVSPSGEQLRDLAALVEAGKVKAPMIESLPLAEAAAAQEKSRAHHVRGKIALKIA